jgi:hypothetical protein
MTSHSQAAVTVLFKQVGDDVVARWTGTVDLGNSWFSDYNKIGGRASGEDSLYSFVGDYELFDGGTAESLTGFGGIVGGSTGTGGFNGVQFFIGGANDGAAPSSSIFDFDGLGVSQTWSNKTLADIGAASFNDTTAWTSSAEDTVSFTTVPEPSSTALVGLGALAIALHRRR